MGTVPNKIPDNRSIILALRQDDGGAAFEIVFKYYYRSLCAYAGRYVAVEETEEIVQSTMMWLWENRMGLIPELSLNSLLFTIVKNKALDRVAHMKRTRKIYDMLADKFRDKFDDPEFYSVEELSRLMAEAIGRLPDSYRKYFEMSRIDGKTHQQIAEELKVSHQTVNYNISKALRLLRDELKDLSFLVAIFII